MSEQRNSVKEETAEARQEWSMPEVRIIEAKDSEATNTGINIDVLFS